MTDDSPKRKISTWWTCGLPGCEHPTRAGATFHGMLMERGFAQVVMTPVQPIEQLPLPEKPRT